MSGAPQKRRRLDSDDDEDEYAQPRTEAPLMAYAVTTSLPTDEVPFGSTEEVLEADTSYAYAKPQSRVSADLNVSTAAVAFSSVDTAAPPASAAAASAEAPLSTASTASTAPVASPVFDEDEDIPAEFQGLFSTELLNMLLVPLDSICKQKTMTDKLLAQYLPSHPPGTGGSVPVKPSTYTNVYGIVPGFRWDGVVRGRGSVN